MVDDGTFLGFLGFEPSISAMALVAVVVLYMHCSCSLFDGSLPKAMRAVVTSSTSSFLEL